MHIDCVSQMQIWHKCGNICIGTSRTVTALNCLQIRSRWMFRIGVFLCVYNRRRNRPTLIKSTPPAKLNFVKKIGQIRFSIHSYICVIQILKRNMSNGEGREHERRARARTSTRLFKLQLVWITHAIHGFHLKFEQKEKKKSSNATQFWKLVQMIL